MVYLIVHVDELVLKQADCPLIREYGLTGPNSWQGPPLPAG